MVVYNDVIKFTTYNFFCWFVYLMKYLKKKRIFYKQCLLLINYIKA
jgi:hypothetical protein